MVIKVGLEFTHQLLIHVLTNGSNEPSNRKGTFSTNFTTGFYSCSDLFLLF